METVYIKISGRVQGVGYRNWAKRTANEIGGLSGWVRNVHDHTVEIFMMGSEDKVYEMIKACQDGPLWARVDGIKHLPATIKGFLPDIVEGRFDII